jgi:polysaccharide export outer membrane protein
MTQVFLLLLLTLSFGQALASPASAQTAAERGVEIPTDYVIGGDDVIGVMFWREPEMSGDVTVRPDGMVTLPLIGELRAAGLRPEQLKVSVQQAATKFLADANVTVVVRQVNSRKVFVTGEVGQSGAYPLTSPRTVLQMIALAGGLSEYAASDKITIMRTDEKGTQTFKFNYKEVMKGRRLEQNITLKPGDTILVP